MDHANDNIRAAIFDDPAWSMMAARPVFWDKMPNLLRSIAPSWFTKNGKRRIDNYVWFIHFQTSWDAIEVKEKREQIEVVK